MPRIKGGVVTRRRHKRLLKQAKGYFGSRRTRYRVAKETVIRALKFAYRDRRTRKRDFRRLWIHRINAGCRLNGLSYSSFIHGLKTAGIDLDRKMLSEIALHHPEVFSEIVGKATHAG